MFFNRPRPICECGGEMLILSAAHDIRSPVDALDGLLRYLPEIPEEERLAVHASLSRIRETAEDLMDRYRQRMIGSGREYA